MRRRDLRGRGFKLATKMIKERNPVVKEEYERRLKNESNSPSKAAAVMVSNQKIYLIIN